MVCHFTLHVSPWQIVVWIYLEIQIAAVSVQVQGSGKILYKMQFKKFGVCYDKPVQIHLDYKCNVPLVKATGFES